MAAGEHKFARDHDDKGAPGDRQRNQAMPVLHAATAHTVAACLLRLLAAEACPDAITERIDTRRMEGGTPALAGL